MRTSEVLNKAADLIEQRGWTSGCSGMFVDGALCAEGAIQAASPSPRYRDDEHLDQPTYDYIMSSLFDDEAGRAEVAVLSYLGTDDGNLFRWNDRQRSQRRVVEVLRATAVIEEARVERTAVLAEPVGVA